ncbi:MAG: VTT domain-containing protein [Symploca sp. SIO2D2]|nr:VTT domain-containing protein [Symploca sp. SIO2D2]
MKSLLKIGIILALIFASTFVVARLAGWLTVDQVKAWFDAASQWSPMAIALLVVLLLFADLFIAVPTLTITLLAGYFLGFPNGLLASFAGMMAAGISGYALSRHYGQAFARKIVKKPEDFESMKGLFSSNGFAFILLSRAAPILPEVSACMAGMNQMKFSRFLAAWILCSLPYALIASYAGSISDLENPKPAIFTAIGLSGTLWLGWFWYRKKLSAKR